MTDPPVSKSETRAKLTSESVAQFSLRPLLIGALVCIVVGILDSVSLQLASSFSWQGWPVFCAFVLFVGQTYGLAWLVGRRILTSPNHLLIWTFFFVWSLVFINLILSVVVFESTWTEAMQSSLVFAFYAAQIGLVMIWGVLGSYDWQRRLPIFCCGLVAASYPLWAMGSYRTNRSWYSILACYLISVFLSCLVLRLLRFQITGMKLNTGPGAGVATVDSSAQFSILYLFIWTTIVAGLVGVGRFVPWDFLWESLLVERIRLATIGGLLMTVITVATCWASLGSSGSVPFRLGVLLALLILVGLGLYATEASNSSSWWSRSSFVGGWSLSHNNADHRWVIFGIWAAWSALNGLFLFGLLQVLAAAGCKLVRTPKQREKIVSQGYDVE
jgi:hypothetical protein